MWLFCNRWLNTTISWVWKYRGWGDRYISVVCLFPERAFLGGNTIISDWMLCTMAPSPRWHVILIVEWSWSSWSCFDWNDTVHAKAFPHFLSLHIVHDIDDKIYRLHTGSYCEMIVNGVPNASPSIWRRQLSNIVGIFVFWSTLFVFCSMMFLECIHWLFMIDTMYWT